MSVMTVKYEDIENCSLTSGHAGCVSNRWQLHASKLILRDIDNSFGTDHVNVTVSTSPHNNEQCLDGIVTQGHA